MAFPHALRVAVARAVLVPPAVPGGAGKRTPINARWEGADLTCTQQHANAPCPPPCPPPPSRPNCGACGHARGTYSGPRSAHRPHARSDVVVPTTPTTCPGPHVAMAVQAAALLLFEYSVVPSQ